MVKSQYVLYILEVLEKMMFLETAPEIELNMVQHGSTSFFKVLCAMLRQKADVHQKTSRGRTAIDLARAAA